MIDTTQIINTIIANPAASAIFGTRVYISAPPTRPTEIYAILSIISDVPVGGEQEVATRTRIELRVIGANQETTFASVKAGYLAIENVLMTTNSFGTFKVYRVTKGTNLVNGRDASNINTIVRDFIFEFTT